MGCNVPGIFGIPLDPFSLTVGCYALTIVNKQIWDYGMPPPNVHKVRADV